MPAELKIALTCFLVLPASPEILSKTSAWSFRRSLVVRSRSGRAAIQFKALRILKTSRFFWSWEDLAGRSSKVSGLPSILAEKSELLNVDCLLMFNSISGGICTESIICRLASIEAKNSEIFGVKKYFGGISTVTKCYQILPNITRYYRITSSCSFEAELVYLPG